MKILKIAKLNNEIVITHDLDFGTLMAFSGESKPSIIIFRIHHISSLIFFNLIQSNWEKIKVNLSDGAIIIFEESNMRIRKLPISK